MHYPDISTILRLNGYGKSGILKAKIYSFLKVVNWLENNGHHRFGRIGQEVAKLAMGANMHITV